MVVCVLVKPDMLKALDIKLNRWMVMRVQAVCREDRRTTWAVFGEGRLPTHVETSSGDPGRLGPPEGVTPMAAKKKAKKKAAKKKK
jgi:hypothetical protein